MNSPSDIDIFEKARGLILAGQFGLGVQLLFNLLQEQPQHVQALQLIVNLANLLKDKNQSITLLREYIKLNPYSSIVFYELGATLLSQGNYLEAINALESAVTLDPKCFEALHDLGASHALLGNSVAAQQALLRAAEINDQSPDLFYNLGRLCDECFEYQKAIVFYKKAVGINPLFTEAWVNLGFDLAVFKLYEQALKCLETAYTQNPHIDFLYGDCLFIRMRMCLWKSDTKLIDRLTNAIEHREKISAPFPVSALIDSPELILTATKIYANSRYPENPLLGPLLAYKNPKIRIAYFSPDFHEHPVSYLMAEVFELHNRDHFEVFAFSFGKNSDDPMRQRLKQSFDHFYDVSDKTSIEIAKLARASKIDIAIDLCGFTENARTEIFALRSAPIQIGYIGYLGSMGVSYMDYIIADEVIIPPKLQKFYSEKILYLPTYQANDSLRKCGERVFTKSEFGISESQFVFCNLNNVYKITQSIFESWLRILDSVPNSVLMLFRENPYAEENLKITAKEKGIDSTRLIFLERLPREDYLSQYKVVDLFLDTFPYNAGATASDALWMGVPVITLQGSSFSSRIASSLLTHLDLTELIHSSLSTYEGQAIELASKPAQLDALRKKLTRNLSSKPLFNSKLFVKHLDVALINVQRNQPYGF